MKKCTKKTISLQTTAIAKKPAKRPRVADARLSELLATAADVFIEQGFDKASLQEIAKRTGASKATLYGRYPNKEALFTAVLQHRMELITEGMTMDNIDASEPLEVSLTRFGTGLLETALTDAQIGINPDHQQCIGAIPSIGRAVLPLRNLLWLKNFIGLPESQTGTRRACGR